MGVVTLPWTRPAALTLAVVRYVDINEATTDHRRPRKPKRR